MVNEFIQNISEDDLRKAKNEYPLGWGKPNYIAGLIVFLICEQSRWITGENIVIDGGHLVRTSH